jgi:hypothetical protein
MGTPIGNAAGLQLTYKAYADSTITPGVEPVAATDPAAGSAQILRRTTSTLSLQKATFASSEIVTSRQVPDFRHGGFHVQGDISGELSPKTYQDFMAGVCRGSWVAGNSKTNATITSLAADNPTSSMTFGASTWAAQGFAVGDVFRPATFDATNTGKNFLITALNGAVATVYPAPATAGADVTVTVAVPGRKLFPPMSNLVIPKFAFEHYFTDLALSHFFSECRVHSMKVSMPPQGIPTIAFGVLGRNMTLPGSPPFFTSPAGITTTTLLTTFGGQLMVGGVAQAIITAADFTIDVKGSTQNVAFSGLVPEVFTGVLEIKGTITVLFLDNTHLNNFINETLFDMNLMMTTANTRSADFISFYFGQVKYTGANFNIAGYAGVPITLPFQAYIKPTTAGFDNTSVTIIDSLSA